MTDAEVVIRKLAVLREHVLRARRRRPASADSLSAALDLQDALCMSLLVAIQEARLKKAGQLRTVGERSRMRYYPMARSAA